MYLACPFLTDSPPHFLHLCCMFFPESFYFSHSLVDAKVFLRVIAYRSYWFFLPVFWAPDLLMTHIPLPFLRLLIPQAKPLIHALPIPLVAFSVHRSLFLLYSPFSFLLLIHLCPSFRYHINAPLRSTPTPFDLSPNIFCLPDSTS